MRALSAVIENLKLSFEHNLFISYQHNLVICTIKKIRILDKVIYDLVNTYHKLKNNLNLDSTILQTLGIVI